MKKIIILVALGLSLNANPLVFGYVLFGGPSKKCNVDYISADKIMVNVKKKIKIVKLDDIELITYKRLIFKDGACRLKKKEARKLMAYVDCYKDNKDK